MQQAIQQMDQLLDDNDDQDSTDILTGRRRPCPFHRSFYKGMFALTQHSV